MGKLNDKAIKAAKADDADAFLSDGGGLYLRVRVSGSKVWLYRYKTGSKTRWLEIGTYPELPLADARGLAVQITAKRKQGIDPIEERENEEARRRAEAEAQAAERAKIDARITVHNLFERWASVDLIRRKDGGAEVRRMFEKDVLPIIGTLAVEDVRKGHITGVTDALLARGVPRMAKLIFGLIRQMFRFAVDRDMIEFEPSASIRKAKIGGKDTERDRVLSEDEVRALTRQLPQSGLSESAQRAVWIAFSTCCRIGELMAARWEHVDFERGTWWIPPEHSKNGKAHTVALSDFALAHFRALNDTARHRGAETWIFPNRYGTGSVCPKTVTKQLGDRQRPGLPPMKGRAKAELSDTLVLAGGKWGPHDLRRTGATMMVELGVLPEVAERCLNHTEQNRVKRTYQRHSYANEMREAWRLLGERLDLLTRTDAANVVPLHTAKNAA
ncbi:MAG: tyrosine-type recombinase/integrase [Proteobacteria bacterium]|nr:tyrosine-type recombinase/integrase [Pseudomonadota bacterium]